MKTSQLIGVLVEGLKVSVESILRLRALVVSDPITLAPRSLEKTLQTVRGDERKGAAP